MPSPPDPAPELVEICQTKPLRMVDQDGVGGGNVQTRFDDAGADEKVMLFANELKHHLLQILLSHLAVSHGQGGLRDKPFQMVGHGMDVLHPVVNKEDLPSPLELPLNGLFDNLIIVPDDKRPDGKPILGRGLNQAETPVCRRSPSGGFAEWAWPSG